jgi:hypothetical protein
MAMAFKNPNCPPKYWREYYWISWVLWNLMGPFSENLIGDTATTFKLLTTNDFTWYLGLMWGVMWGI